MIKLPQSQKKGEMISRLLFSDVYKRQEMSVAGNKKRVFITLDLNILEQLEFLAEKKGVNKSSLISFWISDEYERVKNSEKKDEKK